MHDARLSRPCVYVQRKGEEKTAVCCPVETGFGRCFAVVFGARTAIKVFLMVLRDKTEDGSDGHGPRYNVSELIIRKLAEHFTYV